MKKLLMVLVLAGIFIPAVAFAEDTCAKLDYAEVKGMSTVLQMERFCEASKSYKEFQENLAEARELHLNHPAQGVNYGFGQSEIYGELVDTDEGWIAKCGTAAEQVKRILEAKNVVINCGVLVKGVTP